MGYIITAQQEPPCIKLYYHGNNKDRKPQFYWNIWSMSTRYLRIYKNKTMAENVMKRIAPKIKNYKLCIEEI